MYFHHTPLNQALFTNKMYQKGVEAISGMNAQILTFEFQSETDKPFNTRTLCTTYVLIHTKIEDTGVICINQ